MVRAIAFDASFIYNQLECSYAECSIRCEHFMHPEPLEVFRKWTDKDYKVYY